MSRHPPLPPPDYEPTDGLPRAVAWTGAGLIAGIALVLLASAWVYRNHDRPSPRSLESGPEFSFAHGPDQRLGIDIDRRGEGDRARMRLQTYGWVDREAGVVRIPIARAMERLVVESALQPGKDPR